MLGAHVWLWEVEWTVGRRNVCAEPPRPARQLWPAILAGPSLRGIDMADGELAPAPSADV